MINVKGGNIQQGRPKYTYCNFYLLQYNRNRLLIFLLVEMYFNFFKVKKSGLL